MCDKLVTVMYNITLFFFIRFKEKKRVKVKIREFEIIKEK